MTTAHFVSRKRSDTNSGVVVYSPSGKLNGHDDCFAWLEGVREDIQAGRSRIVLNLGNLEHVDSTGLGILASVHVSATNAGGKACLTGLNDRLRLLFDSTWLFKVIPTAADEEQAIQACGSLP